MGPTSGELQAFLFKLLEKNASPSARSWLESTINIEALLSSTAEFERMYAKTARMLGAHPICPTDNEREILSSHGISHLCGRPLHELGRMILLLQATEILGREVAGQFIENLYTKSDAAERQALLRALPLLPHPHNFLSTAVEACRSHLRTVFEAIACENPYPARHFPEENFCQLIMKSVFLGIPLRRIVGLHARITPLLASMARDYVQEQITAGRPVHDDIHILMNKG